MRRIWIWLLVFALPGLAWGDGMVLPTRAFPAAVTIPDQQALIYYTKGTERLVVETRFTGAGTNFAWVVPLPHQPVVEAATTGLFPTLQYLFAPEIKNDMPAFWLRIAGAVIWLGLFLRFCREDGQFSFVRFLLMVWLGLIVAGLMLPTLSAGARKGMAAGDADNTVEVLDRQVAGVFETTTVASQDPLALSAWLQSNGFALASNTVPVIADYVREGWVFVAAKVRRELAGTATNTPQPLSFTFKTDRPVYPMRLTGANNENGAGEGSLRVALYVFGPGRAAAAHFKMERCVQPDYPVPPEGGYYWGWDRRGLDHQHLHVVHPLLRQWVAGAPVATQLTATLSTEDMRQDVWLDWQPFAEFHQRYHSPGDARNIALNLAALIFVPGLMLIWVVQFTQEGNGFRFWKALAGWLVICLAVAGVIYVGLPKIPVRLERGAGSTTFTSLRTLANSLQEDKPVTAAEIRFRAKELLSRSEDAEGYPDFQNHLLGGPIREEDSPGNFTLRENGEDLEFVGYDAAGAADEEWYMTWHLRPEQ